MSAGEHLYAKWNRLKSVGFGDGFCIVDSLFHMFHKVGNEFISNKDNVGVIIFPQEEIIKERKCALNYIRCFL